MYKGIQNLRTVPDDGFKRVGPTKRNVYGRFRTSICSWVLRFSKQTRYSLYSHGNTSVQMKQQPQHRRLSATIILAARLCLVLALVLCRRYGTP